MKAGRAVLYPKERVEDCRRITIFGSKYPLHVTAIAINENGQWQRIGLDSTALRVGNNSGERRWLICSSCGNRKGVLFRPSRSTRYLCRHCHNLTYWLRQIHRKHWIEIMVRATKLNRREIRVLKGVGRKGFSKPELLQLHKIRERQGSFVRSFKEVT